MATLPALLNQLETLAQAETVNESQASKIITELKVGVCLDLSLKLKKDLVRFYWCNIRIFEWKGTTWNEC